MGREQGPHLGRLEVAESAYKVYGKVVGGKNHMGNPMPGFKDLPPKIQAAWACAVEHTAWVTTINRDKYTKEEYDAMVRKNEELHGEYDAEG
jgi:hypothetical protein